MYETNLKYLCQRYSNNSKPRFSDEEILTIYLFAGGEFGITTIKGMHNFARDFLPDWFPGLVSYQTFVYRLNRMAGAPGPLDRELICSSRSADCMEGDIIADSCPIMTCHGRSRNGRVATEIADKAANDLLARAVSSVRDSIETLFSWLNEKQVFKELPCAAPQADSWCMSFGRSLSLSSHVS